ncbi:MAG: ABC transporter ATP-binding protein [Planctomycetota bacterium]
MAVRIDGLTHRYPKAGTDTPPALDHLDLEVREGEAFALLGPNGSGKSTAFRVLSTLLTPSDAPPGCAQVFGRDVVDDPAAARRQLGVVFQSPSLDGKLTARENLACQARLYGLRPAEFVPRIDEALARFDLTARVHDAVETFSGGMKRRLEIAKALLHGPRLLLMDEPSTGLDPAARRELWRYLGELRRATGLTILWTTHLTEEAEHADRLAVMARGRRLATRTPTEARSDAAGHVLRLRPSDKAELTALRDRVDAAWGPWAEGAEPRVIGGQVWFEHRDGPALVPQLGSLCPGGLREVSLGPPTLEDAYLRLISV